MGAAAAGGPAALRARRGNLFRAAPRGRNEGGARRPRFHAPSCECLERLYHHRHAAYFLFLRVGVRILAGNRPALTGLAGGCPSLSLRWSCFCLIWWGFCGTPPWPFFLFPPPCARP